MRELEHFDNGVHDQMWGHYFLGYHCNVRNQSSSSAEDMDWLHGRTRLLLKRTESDKHIVMLTYTSAVGAFHWVTRFGGRLIAFVPQGAGEPVPSLSKALQWLQQQPAGPSFVITARAGCQHIGNRSFIKDGRLRRDCTPDFLMLYNTTHDLTRASFLWT